MSLRRDTKEDCGGEQGSCGYVQRGRGCFYDAEYYQYPPATKWGLLREPQSRTVRHAYSILGFSKGTKRGGRDPFEEPKNRQEPKPEEVQRKRTTRVCGRGGG